MRTYTMIAAALVASALVPSVARAQQAAEQIPATLTLQDALAIAHRNSPAYLKLQNDADPQAAQIRQRWAQFLPTVSTSMGFSGGSNTTNVGQGDFGDVVTNPEPITVKSSGASQGVSLGLTLFDGGAMFRNLSAARASEDAALAGIDLNVATLDAAVENDFYVARQADMLADVERQNLEKARANYERNQELFRIAAIKQHELLDAQRNMLQSEKSLRQRETEAAKALLNLALTVGIEPGRVFEVAEETPEVFDPAVLDVDALVAIGIERSPTVVQRRAQLAAARQQAAAAKGTWFPTVSASLGYNRSGNERGYGAFGDLNPNRSHGYNFGLQFSFPLFDRFNRNAQITQANVQRDDATQDLRGARLDIEQKVRSGLVDLTRAFADFQLAQQLAQVTQQQADLADEQFRLGALDFLNYQRIIDQNVQAQRDAVLARFAFNQARVTLEQNLGSPINR
jgi:outer membrane protein